MKIKEITYQRRRDFTAIMECEDCGAECEDRHGYDSRFYHDTVIPAMPCPECGKSRNDLGITHAPTKTKYEPWEVI